MDQFALYELVERNAGELIMNKRKLFKPVCANVDFYSGFVYTMLGIPRELFTPIFAIARISGWCAHRLEELVNQGKIIRPAYKYVGTHKQFGRYRRKIMMRYTKGTAILSGAVPFVQLFRKHKIPLFKAAYLC